MYTCRYATNLYKLNPLQSMTRTVSWLFTAISKEYTEYTANSTTALQVTIWKSNLKRLLKTTQAKVDGLSLVQFKICKSHVQCQIQQR